MDDYIAVYLYDVKRAIEEVESFFADYPMLQIIEANHISPKNYE